MKAQKHGITRLINATRYSKQGLGFAWKHESAFREEVIASIVLVIAAFFLADNHIEVILLVGSCLIVMMVELINSAIEAVVDRIGTEHHPLAGAAKDVASAAVLMSLILFIFTWAVILINKITDWF